MIEEPHKPFRSPQVSPMTSRPLTIFFSAGEPSGDLHGANLITELKRQSPGFKAIGYGGPKMQAAGCELQADLTALAVMWFLRALLNIHKFWSYLWQADRCFREQRPDAVVLIDFPGFNWWIARRAKAHGIPVFYYAPPQIWAWARWRVKKMRRLVDHVLCALPFERDWLVERGCRATLVGHPFFDEVRRHDVASPFRSEERTDNRPLVVILPGSRTQEVKHNLPWFIKAAEQVHRQVPEARFAIAAFKRQHADMASDMLHAAGRKFPVEIHVGRTPVLISQATCAMAVSGSVSLELMYYRMPTVILYKIGRVGYFLQQFFRKVKYITLVNLLSVKDPFDPDITPYHPSQADAADVLFPEYLTCSDRSADVARHVIEWLTDSTKRSACREALGDLCERVGHPGACENAVRLILADLHSKLAAEAAAAEQQAQPQVSSTETEQAAQAEAPAAAAKVHDLRPPHFAQREDQETRTDAAARQQWER